MMYPVIRNNWLDNAFDELFNSSWMPRMNTTAPAVNVRESEKAFVMDIAAPGLKKEFCRVNIDKDGNLVVKIENKVEHKDADKREHYLRREFSYSNYEQAYSLPENVDKEHIGAKVEDGILSITLPKVTKEDVKIDRQIEIGYGRSCKQ